MLHFCKFINTFYYDHLMRPTVTFLPINSALLISKPIVKPRLKAPSTKQKLGRPAKANDTSKYAKRAKTSSFLSHFWPCLNNKQKISSGMYSLLCSALLFDLLIFHFLVFFSKALAKKFFPTNNLALLVFFYQSSSRLEVFYR